MIKWKELLRSMNVHSSTYAPEAVRKKDVVYIKVACTNNIAQNMLYIGCTGVSITEREKSRVRKMAQLFKDNVTNAEHFLKFTASHGTYVNYLTIVILESEHVVAALQAEAFLIASYRPFHNANSFNRIAGKSAKYQTNTNFKRLMRRAERLEREKLSIPREDLCKNMTQHSKCHALITRLCMKNHKAFLAQRVLMTRKTRATTLYLIHRIMQHIAQPGKGIGIMHLKKVFQKRNLKWP